jgi:head-tail adaptor
MSFLQVLGSGAGDHCERGGREREMLRSVASIVLTAAAVVEGGHSVQDYTNVWADVRGVSARRRCASQWQCVLSANA